ncbi:MAG TPA: mannitol dehydrogenase family protein, partial [Methylomirabilota bacterium]|nr:mannitol dehydrogenase family protein [Methylomirabilota bacterium]
MVERLSDRTLGTLASGIARPRYDRASVRAGIVHLGIGAFHRAHQAVYIDDCLAAGESDWGIVGASLRSSATRHALAPQDGLYTLNVRSSDSESLRVIGSVVGLAVAPEDPSGLVATLSNPAIRLVTLTVSEKAYLRDAAGDLDATHAAVRA